MKIRTETSPAYTVTTTTNKTDDEIIAEALAILGKRMRVPGVAIKSPQDTKDFLTLRLAEQETEVFCCIYLDNRHRVIAFEEVFQGTIDNTTVHPREIVRRCMKHNAAAIILAHNHPSGVVNPSEADRHITTRIRGALEWIDVRVLDHFIVGGTDCLSLAEKGLI